MRQNILYKIYMGRKCVYIDGTSTNDLTAILRLHFFGTDNKIDIERVSKIEYAILPSMSDLFVYKAYFINLIKPIYNKHEKARDILSESIELPDLNFVEYNNPIMEKWKSMLKTNQINLFEEFNT